MPSNATVRPVDRTRRVFALVPWALLTRMTAIVLVALAVASRFAVRSPLWLDEALTVNIASLPVADIPGALRQDGHPPLYYFLLHYWIDFVGDGDSAVRALSGLFGLLSLPLAHIAGRRFGGRSAGRLAVAFVAVSPFAVRYSSEVRMYSLMTLLGLALWLSVETGLRRPSWLWTAVVTLLTAAILLTHYWGSAAVAAGFLWLVWARRSWVGAARVAAGRMLGALVAGGLLFLPWTPVLLDQVRHTGTPWATSPTPPTMVVRTMVALAGGDRTNVSLALLMVLSVVLAMGYGTERWESSTDRLPTAVVVPRGARDARRPVLVIVAVMTIGILMVTVADSAYEPRYSAVVFGAVAVVAALGMSRLEWRWAGALLALTVLTVSVLVDGDLVREERTQGRQVAEALEAAAPGDLVIFCPDQLGPATTRYLRTDVRAVAYPDLTDPRFVNWSDYAERMSGAEPEMVANRILEIAGGSGVWMVWQGGYRTLGDSCQRLELDLALRLGPGETVVAPAEEVFEPARLVRFPR